MSKIRVLFLAADSSGLLRQDEEARQIRQKVRGTQYGDEMEFDFRWTAQTDDLLEALSETHPQVLHFSGHVHRHGIVLTDVHGGWQPLDVDALAGLLLAFRVDLRVVVLSASNSLAYAEALTSAVDCAIGTRTRLSNEAAIAFNSAFYGAVASGDSVLAAFEQASTMLKQGGFDEDTECPELVARCGVDPTQVILISSHGIADGKPATPNLVTSPAVNTVPLIRRDSGQVATLKILFFAADASNADRPRLQLDEEARQIRQKVRAARHGDAVMLDFRWATRANDLLDTLNETHPQVLHFSGHSESGSIMLMSDDGRKLHPLNGDALAELLLPFQKDLRVVVVSTCHSLVHAAAITSIVDCAIVTRTFLSDKAAIVFNAAFYSAVAFGHSVLTAFQQACAVLKLGRLEGECPELVVRSGVDPAQLVLISSNEKATQQQAAPQLIISPTVFAVPPIPCDPDLVAVLMPFSRTFAKTYLQIRTACEAVGLSCECVDPIWEDSTARQSVFDLIYRSAAIVVDLSGRNSNVMYECGIAHTLGRPVLPISRSTEVPPFNWVHQSVLTYLPNAEGFAALREALESRLRSITGRASK